MAKKKSVSTKSTGPTNDEKIDAYTAGRSAFDNEKEPITACPYEDGSSLADAWKRGWAEASDTRSEQILAESQNITESAENTTDSTASNSEAPQNITHEFNAPAVMESREKLAALMLAFDNIGVAIDETQWRALPEGDQTIAVAWANDRRIGAMRPCPTALLPFANEQLRSEIAVYQNEQREIGRVVMPVKFGKHSETKPDGDDSEPKIKMSLLVPVDKGPSASVINQLFGWKRCRIEFGRRSIESWDQMELPNSRTTFTCVADVSGFSRNRTHWKFGFFVNMSEVSIEDAYSLWKDFGSCRVECLGEPPKDERNESENPENDEDDEDEPDDVRQPDLFGEDENPVNNDGQYRDFDTFCLQLTKADCDLRIAKDGDKFHIASLLTISLTQGEEPSSFGDDLPTDEDDGYASVQVAMESEVGWLIDALKASDPGDDAGAEILAVTVDELRDWLKRISAGEEPKAVTSDDVSY